MPSKCEGIFQGDYLRLLWDRAPYDGDIEYRVTYKSSTGESKQVTTSMTGISINDFDTTLSKEKGNYGTVDVIITGSDGNKYTANSSLSCISSTAGPTPAPIDTIAPSISPTTTAPTTAMPSKSPITPYPTSEQIGYFLDGSYHYDFCNNPRCNCFEDSFDCCTTSKEDAFDRRKCDIHYKQIIVTPDNDDVNATMLNKLRVQMYPDTYSYESTICWEMDEPLEVNKTHAGLPDDGSSGQERRRRRRLGSNSGDDGSVNDIKVGLYPLSGCVRMNSINDTTQLPMEGLVNLTAYQREFECVDDNYDGECYYKCRDIAIKYPFELINCSTNNPTDPMASYECKQMFPYKLNIYVSRSDCDRFPHPSNSPLDSQANESWVWWIIIAFVIFMIILGWLAYRFWITKRGTIHGLKQHGLSQQLAEADKEFMDDLVHGGGDVIDEEQQEIEMKKKVEDAESQMVDVEHDVFQVRQQSSVSFDEQSPR